MLVELYRCPTRQLFPIKQGWLTTRRLIANGIQNAQRLYALMDMQIADIHFQNSVLALPVPRQERGGAVIMLPNPRLHLARMIQMRFGLTGLRVV